MEGVHTVKVNIPNFPDYSFFGIYDGHGGANLHLNIFKKIHEIGEDYIEKAIKDAFIIAVYKGKKYYLTELVKSGILK